MILDIITLLILLWAVFKGISQGLVVALFSLLAVVVGVAAALKFSVFTADWLGTQVSISQKWLPVVAFLLVFIVVVIGVNLIGKLLEKSFELAFLGWLNKAGGILFFALLHLLLWSVLLFYLAKTGIITEKSMEESNTYAIIAPWGPKAMEWMGQFIPVFQDMFKDLGKFFDSLPNHVEPAKVTQ